MARIYVLHENSAWVEPLREAFDELGLPYEEWFLDQGTVPFEKAPPQGVFYNRMSASSHTRGHRYAPELTHGVLNWLEAHGRRVANGTRALYLEVSKLAQYAALNRAGVKTPRTVAAVGRDNVLDAARAFEDTEAANADLHLVVATTARRRDMAKPIWSPRQAAAELRAAAAADQATGVLFGGERAGLDNDDVARAHAVVEVPANPAFASLNLAQAVLLMGYEWFRTAAAEPGPEIGLDGSPRATAAELDNFMGRLEAALDAAGYFRPPEKKPSMRRAIRNTFVRARVSEQEVRTLHGILSALVRREDG